MLDFDAMLRRALAQTGGERIALGTPYDLPDRIARDLMKDTALRALIADGRDHADLSPQCAGWWVDRGRGRVFLRRGVADTLLIAGIDPRHVVGGGLLLEARLKGVARIVTCDNLGGQVEDLDVVSALEERLDSPHRGQLVGELDFSEAFRLIFKAIGDRLRLPASAFDRRSAVLCIGSLGPGGAERQAAMTAAGIQRSGALEAIVLGSFTQPQSEFFRPFVEAAGARVESIDPSPDEAGWPMVQELTAVLNDRFGAIRMGEVFLEIIRYAAALRRLRPGVVHTWMDYCNALCGAAATLVGVPRLVMSGRSVAPQHFRIFQPYMRAGYESVLKRRPVSLLNNSRAGAEDYAAWLRIPADEIRVIHNGFDFPDVDHDSARRDIRAALGIAPGQKVVGAIMRFSEEKQPDLLIDMAIALHRRDPDLRFVFCGGGVMLEDMRTYVRTAGLEGAITLPGVVEGTWRYLAAMDVFVLTSRMEGLPNVLIEAQASGRPVVCTGVGGMAETFIEGETGIAVRDATPDRLADAVLAILSDDHRLQVMSEKAAVHARQTFGIARLVSDTLATYGSPVSVFHKSES